MEHGKVIADLPLQRNMVISVTLSYEWQSRYTRSSCRNIYSIIGFSIINHPCWDTPILGKPQISHVDPNITFQKTTQQLTELTDAQLTLIVTCLPFGPKTRFFLEVISSMAPVPGEQKSRQKRVVSWWNYGFLYAYPLVMTNIAMENGPFIDGLPIKKCATKYEFVECAHHCTS